MACLVKRHRREVDQALEHRAIGDIADSLGKIPPSGCPPLTVDAAKAIEQRGLLFVDMYRQYGPQAGRAAANIITRWPPVLPPNDPRAGWYVV